MGAWRFNIREDGVVVICTADVMDVPRPSLLTADGALLKERVPIGGYAHDEPVVYVDDDYD